MLKSSQSILLKPLSKIFNLVLSTGHYPASWSKGRIISLHKKGDPSDPANYRGITITSALGKLFNSILNVRLCDFLNKNNILCAEQSGFRNNHRTSDHLFILKNLMARYKRQRKSLYIAFIDFKQAFDTVCHTRLLYKLLRCGISNKFYDLIKSMYSNIQVAVQDGSGKNISTFFKSLVGVRQGDNLSPTLFNIFINDLPKIFDDSCAPTRIGSTPFNAMLYADDLMVISETQSGLQEAMYKLEKYCSSWSMKVNTSKSKFMVTTGDRVQPCTVTYQQNNIEQVSSFKYLGIEVSKDGTVSSTMKDLYRSGLKAYFKLMRSLKPLPKPSTLLNLFDHLIKPILLYGCEIWAPLDLKYRKPTRPLTEKASFTQDLRDQFPYITKYMDRNDPTEILHLKLCKRALGVHSKATNMAVYAELGRYPLFVDQLVQSLKYMDYIQNETENKLLKEFFEAISKDKWENPLTTLGNQLAKYMRTIPPVKNKKAFFASIKKNFKISFGEYLHRHISSEISMSGKKGGNKLRTYKLFKNSLAFEPYLKIANPEKRRLIAQFRTSAHRLHIETGRFGHNNTYVPPDRRLCECCSMGQTEDEFHFLIECPKYLPLRTELFSSAGELNKYFDRYSPELKFVWIMSNENENVINQLGTFLIDAFRMRNHLMQS